MDEKGTKDDWLADSMTLQQAADSITIAGQKITRMRLWYWCTSGINGVTLNYSRLGKTFIVRRADLNEFLESVAAAQSAGAEGRHAGRPTVLRKRVSPEKRKKQLDEARENLRRQGIG
jgi:hypothetical protein